MSPAEDERRPGRRAVLDRRDLDQAIPNEMWAPLELHVSDAQHHLPRNVTCDGETRIFVASMVLDPGLVPIAQEPMQDDLT